jgi:hypothetical protein
MPLEAISYSANVRFADLTHSLNREATSLKRDSRRTSTDLELTPLNRTRDGL